MKTINTILLCSFLLLVNNVIRSQSFINSSPKNNSSLVKPGTSIILRSDKPVDALELSNGQIKVDGTESGEHQGTLKLSDDKLTILFIPEREFNPGETVNVAVAKGIKTVNGNLPDLTFTFKITPLKEPIDINTLSLQEYRADDANNVQAAKNLAGVNVSADSLPANFPVITIGTINNPSDDKLLLANQSSGGANASIGNYLMILNNDGTPVKYMSLAQSASLFKMEPNGELSYNSKGDGSKIVTDTLFAAIDTFKCGSGYKTDGHDFLLMPNGHVLLFASDPEPVDMSIVIPGGNPNAVVTGAVIQELDAAHNIVFQWRSWDYLSITDSYFDLTSANIDYVHANSITVDNDGNILFSMRHFSSIIKINRSTGDIMWTLGGKKNQFGFINENEVNSPTYFSYQHDITMLPSGNLTLFDNGNQHPVNYSRGVEYKIDEEAKTATLVWEYRHSPDLYSSAMGSMQRLSNGNSIIGWGMMSESSSPVLTEVHPDKTVALEIFLPKGQICYRALKYPWSSSKTTSKVTVTEILQGNTYTFSNKTDTTGVKIKFTELNSGLYTNAVVTKYNYAPVSPLFSDNPPNIVSNYFTIASNGINSYKGEVHVNLNKFPSITNPGSTIVYGMSEDGSGYNAQPTSYDSAKGELVFTTSLLGKFIFGIPQSVSALAPITVSPQNNEIVNGESAVTLMWGSRGIVQSYNIQISADSLFTNPLVNKGSLTANSLTVAALPNNAVYYWRVNNVNLTGTSAWSSVSKFVTASPFINVSYPAGGNNIYVDSTYVIRWVSNISDAVNIDLYKDGKFVYSIADSVVSNTKAYLWQVPSGIKTDSTYKILVESAKNLLISAFSSNNFSIDQGGISGVTEKSNVVKDYSLEQNYPNPFNPSTSIRYSIPVDGQVNINVFNMLGQKIISLENSFKKAGEYQIQWNASNLPSGLYIYTISAANGADKKFTMSKKMLLLK